MNERQQFCSAVKKIAWGYLFLYLNLNLGTLNILPNWFFYVLLLQAIPNLKTIVPSVSLLRPLAIILGIWEAIIWIYAACGGSIQAEGWAVIPIILRLYLNFQLLTDLATISKQYSFDETANQILHLRTISTILVTVYNLPIIWTVLNKRWPDVTNAVLILLAICFFLVAMMQCYTLFKLKCCLDPRTDPEE